MVLLGIQSGALIRRRGRAAHTHIILDQPFVDGFGGVCHEYTALEIGLAEHIGERGGMINMETMS